MRYPFKVSFVHRSVLILLLALLGAGCSFQFGDTEELPLLGQPPPLSRYPRLNHRPVHYWERVRGGDNRLWAVICEPGTVPPKNRYYVCEPGRLVLRHVTDPSSAPSEKLLTADRIYTGYYTGGGGVYLLDFRFNAAGETRLRIHTTDELGDAPLGPGTAYLLPAGEPYLQPGGSGEVFVYWIKAAGARRFYLLRRDGTLQRALDLPRGADPLHPPTEDDLFFDLSGAWLFGRDRDGALVGYSTGDADDLHLGMRPRWVRLHPQGKPALVTCGDDGLKVLYYQSGKELTLDLMPPCDPDGLSLEGPDAVRAEGDQQLRIPLDGRPAFREAKPAMDQKRIIADGNIYTYDAPNRYLQDATSGFLGDWQFMERGLIKYSQPMNRDKTRVRWVEHAANPMAVGDLLSAAVPRGAPVLLARNVPFPWYTELPDGRILAVANHAFPGTHNRIIVIDEQTRTARWVANSADAYYRLSNGKELVVDVFRNEQGYDLYRLPLP